MLIMLVCVLLVIVMVCLGSVMFWVGECFVLCNLQGFMQVCVLDGSDIVLVIDLFSGIDVCVGYWLQQLGWYQLCYGDIMYVVYVFDLVGVQVLYCQ